MNKKAFRQLLRKYLNNTCTEDEKRIVDQWYDLLDSNQIILPDDEISDVESRLWEKIRHSTHNFKVESATFQSPRQFRSKYLLVAAGIAGICLAAAIWLSVRTGQSTIKPVAQSKLEETAPLKKGFLQIANNSDTILKLKMEEGSLIEIFPHAKLNYPKQFAANKREVYLDGDASFDISKNPNRPFFVYNNQIVTQVLGTSFTIHRRNNQVEVNVKTGRVAVYENKDQIILSPSQQKSNGVIITPNQKVVYNQTDRYFITSVVDDPLPVQEGNRNNSEGVNLKFAEIPLFKVLKDLESVYELEIVIENEKIKDCLFTGDLRKQNLFNCLESICLVFNASYEIKGTKLLLKGGIPCS